MTSRFAEEDYVYKGAGNLTSKTVDSVTTTYTYDDIDQLLTESRSGYSSTYSYDANGNRASKTLNGTTEVYTNDDADKLTEIKVSGVTVKSFGYDGAGRTTSVVTGAGTTTLAYDYESRVTTITYPSTATNTFAYNGLDTRVGKVDSAGTATYKRDGAHVTAPVISDGSATYTPGISERRSSTTKYYGADRLGTNSIETNSSQAVAATKAYDAFGMPVGSTGSSASPFGFAGQHGYQEDIDSGLKLLGHRYYDTSTGRFLTRDPIKYGRNWYGYCENNPAKFVDDFGLRPKWLQTIFDAVSEASEAVGRIGKAGLKFVLVLPAVVALGYAIDHAGDEAEDFREFKKDVRNGIEKGKLTDEQGEDLIRRNRPGVGGVGSIMKKFWELVIDIA